jgi:uridylate kinase
MQSNLEKAVVIKFGGSTTTNERGANREYLKWFFHELGPDFQKIFSKAAFIIGGGPRVRLIQANLQTQQEKDLAGIRATQEHAQQMGEVMRAAGIQTEKMIPTNPAELRKLITQQKKFAVALGGIKIGQTTDAVAVTAAELYAQQELNAKIVILSNVWSIFTSDPKQNPDALPIQQSSIPLLIEENVLAHDPAQFRSGMSVTIDPIAVHSLEQQGNKSPHLFFGHAEDIGSITDFLFDKTPINGTVLSPKNPTTIYHKR